MLSQVEEKDREEVNKCDRGVNEFIADHIAATEKPLFKKKVQRKTKSGRLVSEISHDELESCFHLPEHLACKQLGIGLTVFKRTCRQFSICRWPYRKVQRLHQLLQKIEAGFGTLTDFQSLKTVLDGLKQALPFESWYAITSRLNLQAVPEDCTSAELKLALSCRTSVVTPGSGLSDNTSAAPGLPVVHRMAGSFSSRSLPNSKNIYPPFVGDSSPPVPAALPDPATSHCRLPAHLNPFADFALECGVSCPPFLHHEGQLPARPLQAQHELQKHLGGETRQVDTQDTLQHLQSAAGDGLSDLHFLQSAYLWHALQQMPSAAQPDGPREQSRPSCFMADSLHQVSHPQLPSLIHGSISFGNNASQGVASPGLHCPSIPFFPPSASGYGLSAANVDGTAFPRFGQPGCLSARRGSNVGLPATGGTEQFLQSEEPSRDVALLRGLWRSVSGAAHKLLDFARGSGEEADGGYATLAHQTRDPTRQLLRDVHQAGLQPQPPADMVWHRSSHAELPFSSSYINDRHASFLPAEARREQSLSLHEDLLLRLRNAY